MTGPQLVILQELSNGEMTVSELARRISLSQGTVTDIIHRLENKHLIIKRRGNRDKRRVLVALSEMCKDLLVSAPPPLQEKFMNYFSQIEEWEQFLFFHSVVIANQRVRHLSYKYLVPIPNESIDSFSDSRLHHCTVA